MMLITVDYEKVVCI